MGWDTFKVAGLGQDNEPAITQWSFEDLGDSPEQHRWRAWWRRDYSGSTTGIELVAYPVIRATECGVWIDEYAWRDATKQPWEEGAPGYQWHHGNKPKKRLILNGSGAGWAKPTRDEAVRSLAMRLTRWASFVARDVERVVTAASAMQKLRPDLSSYPMAAKSSITSIYQEIKNG